jgi:alkylation response protein AidB-like acyl-CoA dehydrogenase
MITSKTLKLSLKSLKDFAKKRLPDEVLRDLDERDECPLDIVRHMCSPDKLGIQLLFIPEEFGGMGGNAFDVYCVCEEMARIDLGVATAVLATFLGSDPITVGATPRAEENLADAHRRRGITVRVRRDRAGSGQRFGFAEDDCGASHRSSR